MEQHSYSGVSWAVNDGLKKVNVIKDWPNPLFGGIGFADKVPSTISYQDGKGQELGLRGRA